MTAEELIRHIWNLHAKAPDVARFEPDGLAYIRREAAHIVEELSSVLEARSRHPELAAVMRQSYIDALVAASALNRDMECRVEDETVDAHSMEWHVVFVIGVVTSMVTDLLFRVLEVYAELAANLDGSRPGFRQAPRILDDCAVLLGVEDEADHILNQVAESFRSCATTELEA